VATLNGTILNSAGLAPSPWQRWPRGCPLPGPIPVTRGGDLNPVVAHSHIYFRPLQTPYVDTGLAGALVIGGSLRARIDGRTGAFTLQINQGNYAVTVGAECFEINIPSDAGTFTLAACILTAMTFQPPGSNTYQGNFPSAAANFVLPANAVNNTGVPVATAWTQVVQGPGKFQIVALLTILATTRGNGAQDNEVYTAYLWDTTDAVMVGLEVSVENIFTGTQGQMIVSGTVTILGATQILLEVYAAGNPNVVDQTAAPLSVGTIVMGQSSISITRLQ
jgi:hypothetical protein